VTLSSAEKVYQAIRGKILKGEFPASSPLRASALARDFGWGLTPIREGLTRLLNEKLVQVAFNSGFAVTAISSEELTDLGEVRALIETEMLDLAIRNGDEDWEGRVVAAAYQLNRVPVPNLAMDEEGLTRWEIRHQGFHDALVSAGTSEWLIHLRSQIDAQLQLYHRNILAGLRVAAQTQTHITAEVDQLLAQCMGAQGHADLMEAALERRADEALALFRTHAALSLQCYSQLQNMMIEHKAA
jgi:DNA-binding GntR family transcriptional regulator